MFVHIHRKGAEKELGISAPRVTMQEGSRFGYRNEKCLIVGTLPNINVLPMSEVDWFWVEED